MAGGRSLAGPLLEAWPPGWNGQDRARIASMSVLAFFPWLTATGPATIGKFRLVPHRVAASLEAQPRLVDAILAPYQEPGGAPVESATLVQASGRSLTDDLRPDEEAALLRLGDAVGFAALARRVFFESGPYLNRDHLTLVIRRFSGTDPRAIQVVTRRRDGRRWVAYDVGSFRTTRPPHAPRPARCELDTALAASVLDAFAAADGASLQDAIAAFNACSGDGDETSSAHGLYSLVWALERLLEPAAGEELPVRLLSVLAPFFAGARAPRRLIALRRLETLAEPRRPPSTSIVEAWARDLLRARAVVSGRRGASYWSPDAHLLLGAHLFPVAVLGRLAVAGLRPLTDADRGALLAFPYLASLHDPFARRRSLAARNPHLWQRALEVAGRRLARIQLAEVLERTGAAPRRDVTG